MTYIKRKLLELATVPFLILALGGCGGGGGDAGGVPNGGSAVATRSSVALFLTDGPVEPGLFSAVNIRIERVELVAEGGDVFVVRDGPAVTVNLMDLSHDAIPLSYGEGVPVGRYCQIRVSVDSVELVLASGGRVHPALPANGTLTLVPEGCFDVNADGVAHVELDLDIGKSIYEQDGEYRLRPVFYVDVIRAGRLPRLLRLEGRIADFDGTDRLLLCDSLPILRNDQTSAHGACAWVQVTADSGFFDNVSYGGRPRPLAELFASDKLGQRATVAGVVRGFGHRYLELDIPDGQRPPPGECKLWFPERPAGQQPPPKPCDELIATASVDTVVIDHAGRIVLDRRGLVAVSAVAVELGEFARVDGAVADPVAAGTFTIDVAPGGAITSDAPLPVELQDAPVGGNGTRIVSKTGAALSEADLLVGREVSVDGIIVSASGATSIRSALVVVDVGPVSVQRLSGTVLAATTTGATVSTSSAADNPCANAAGNVDVAIDGTTRFLTVIVTDDSSTTVMGGSLGAGQAVDVYGQCRTTGVFDARQVVIIDDRRTP